MINIESNNIVLLIDFQAVDLERNYFNNIGDGIVLQSLNSSTDSIDIDPSDVAIVNYIINSTTQKALFQKFSFELYARKIIIIANIQEIDTLLDLYPNFDYIIKRNDYCRLNSTIIKSKIKCNSETRQLNDSISHLASRIETYRSVLNASPEAIIMIDEAGIIIGSNDYIENMIIRHDDDYTGKNIFDLISIGLASVLSVNLAKSIHTGESVDFIFSHFDSATEYKIVPVEQKCESNRFILFTQNIIGQELALRALKFNTEMINNIVHNLPVAIWNIDHLDRIIIVAGKLPHSALPNEIGTNINDYFKNFPEFISNLNSAKQGKISYSIDKFADVFVESYYSTLTDELGGYTGIIAISNDITDKVTAEIQIEEEKNKLSFAFQSYKGTFWEYDFQTKTFESHIIDNANSQRPLTNALPNLSGDISEMLALIHDEDLAYIVNAFRSLELRELKTAELHYRMSNNNSDWFWIESRVNIFEYDELSGMPRKLIGVSRDVSDQVANDRLVQQSKNLVDIIINSGDHYFMLLDKSYKVLAFNNMAFDNLLSLLNIYIKQGMQFDEIFKDSNESSKFIEHFRLALKGEDSSYEHNYLDNVGYDYWLEHFFYPIQDIEGETYAVNIISKQINDRKLIEQELIESKATLQAILDTSPIGIVLLTNDKILWSNKYWQELIAYPSDYSNDSEFSFCQFCTSKHFCNDCANFLDSDRFKTESELELSLISLNGDKLDCIVNAKCIKDNPGERDILITVLDITERKREQLQREALLEANISAEKKRNEAISLIESSARIASIGVISSGITHEITQPLNAIRVASDGILFWNRNHNMALPDQVTRLIHKISNATMKVDDIIQHMRAYWLDSSKNDCSQVNLSDSIQKALSLTLQRVQSHEVYLKIEKHNQTLLVAANPLQLEIIINNLLINAMQSLDKSNVKNKTIIIKTGIIDNRTYLSVADNGLGLPDVPNDSLFDPFFSTKQGDTGTGLGLAIVKLFANRFSAEIKAENQKDGGAIFTIIFSEAAPISSVSRHSEPSE